MRKYRFRAIRMHCAKSVSYTHLDVYKRQELYPALSEDDKRLIDLFYLQFDNANVLKLLKDKDAAIDVYKRQVQITFDPEISEWDNPIG